MTVDAEGEVDESPPVPANDDFERRLFSLETNSVGTIKVLRELVQRMKLLTVAVPRSAVC